MALDWELLFFIIINSQQLTWFKKQRILDQALLSHYSAKNVLIIQHVLCVTTCALEHVYRLYRIYCILYNLYRILLCIINIIAAE
jgi:hypothetical protein